MRWVVNCIITNIGITKWVITAEIEGDRENWHMQPFNLFGDNNILSC